MSTHNPNDSSTDVYDIPSFCRSHKISRAFFYHLVGEGRGPRTIKLGRRVLISKEAAAAWRAALEGDE